MTYRELKPLPGLAPVLDCIWLLEGDAADEALQTEAQPILPDGRPELILHFGDRFERLNDTGVGAAQPWMIYAGQVTSPLLLRPTGRVSVLGIRFHPYGASVLLEVPQHEVAGLTIGIELLSPRLRRDLQRIRDHYDDPTNAAAAVQGVLQRWVKPERIDRRVRFGVETIGRARGVVSMDALARAAGVSRRHLERQFLDDVGVTPKRLARIVRFQHAVRCLENVDAHRAGVETATACGYADQSHFIRDFRQFAGCSPSQHLLRQGELTGFFIEGR
jgi:AraC-like DNA-binding protein